MLFCALRRWIFDLVAGGVCQKEGSAEGPVGLMRSPVFSGAGGFCDGCGDLAKGSVDVVRMDGGGTTPGGTEPGGLGQKVESARVALTGLGKQIDGSGLKDVALQSGTADLPVEVRGDVMPSQWGKHGGGADASEEGSLNGETEAAKEVFVARKDEGEGTAHAAAKP